MQTLTDEEIDILGRLSNEATMLGILATSIQERSFREKILDAAMDIRNAVTEELDRKRGTGGA